VWEPPENQRDESVLDAGKVGPLDARELTSTMATDDGLKKLWMLMGLSIFMGFVCGVSLK
jgi:hypothetical protein